MSFYFTARSDKDAIGANRFPGGPSPGNGRYPSIHERDALASPHFWQLTALANDIPYEDQTSELRNIWPVATDPAGPGGEPAGQFIQGLPDSLRDDLARIACTPAIAAAWSECVWSMDAAQAEDYIRELAQLAAQARREDKHIYWWSTL